MPERQSCHALTEMCGRQIHPSIVVEICDSNPGIVLDRAFVPRLTKNEFTFPWVFENARVQSRYKKIHGTIIVVIGPQRSPVMPLSGNPFFFADVCKSAVSV